MTEIKTGIPRAREVLFRIETLTLSSTPNFTATVGAMALQAQAIAAVEQAEATRLCALVAVLESPIADVAFTVDERNAMTNKIREIIGLPPLPDEEG